MKKTVFTAAIILAAGIGLSINAQVSAPPGAGDRSLQDRDVKGRAVELERISRDADKNKSKKKDKDKDKIATEPQPEERSEIELKYPEIKEDFEQMQMSYDAIIKAYRPDATTDYKKIVDSSAEIKKRSERLKTNLFAKTAAETTESPKEEKENKDAEKSLRDLIVALDSSVGNFTASPIFQNLRAPDPAEAAKAQAELENIMKVSDLIGKKASEKL
jgi:hypothetical protein